MKAGKALFAAEFEPALANGRRRAPRAPVSLDARLGRGGLDRALCKVSDLSQQGARLQTYSLLRRDSVIWLMLPLVGQVAATVRWSDDFEAGCQFQQPLDAGVFEELLALGGVGPSAC
jgi:hypothetical protein